MVNRKSNLTSVSQKAVHFKPTVRVKRVAARSLYSKELKLQIWISKEERKQSMLSVHVDELHPSIFHRHRNLRRPESHKARQSTIEASRKTVLREQRRLPWALSPKVASTSTNISYQDENDVEPLEDRIAKRYGEQAKEAAALGRARGMEQSQAANNMFEMVDFPSPSPSTSSLPKQQQHALSPSAIKHRPHQSPRTFPKKRTRIDLIIC
eukprot:scaffold3821_cov127-Cylindrotheca_fusiformis.AAC.9